MKKCYPYLYEWGKRSECSPKFFIAAFFICFFIISQNNLFIPIEQVYDELRKGIVMIEYIDIFKSQAKSLLKEYRAQNSTAKLRCQKVFGKKEDLSLMNMQHVIAKEYGFDSWNNLQSSDDTKLATALIEHKNLSMQKPLRFYADDKGEAMFEASKQKLITQNPHIDFKTFQTQTPFGDFSLWLDLSYMDLSAYDLSQMDVSFVTYSDLTVWSKDVSKLPSHFQPKEFLEERKNFGLGIKNLHKQGITGQNRAMAVIDWRKLSNHLEYYQNIKGYEELDVLPEGGDMSGGQLVSALVGKTCGVAPDADVYYYSVGTIGRSQTYYALALNEICDLHEELIKIGKNGIDAVCLLRGLLASCFQDDEGAAEFKQAAERAHKLGIWLSFDYQNYGAVGVGCKIGGDVENFEDYELFYSQNPRRIPDEKRLRQTLCFPAGRHTVAGSDTLKSYIFNPYPANLEAYKCGLYLLAKSVNSNLSGQEFWQKALATGDFKENIGIIINPQRLIESL